MTISTTAKIATAALASVAMFLSGCVAATSPEPTQLETPTETQEPEATTTITPAPAPTAGEECDRLGKVYRSDSLFFECRYQAGMNLAYVELDNNLVVPAAEIRAHPLRFAKSVT